MRNPSAFLTLLSLSASALAATGCLGDGLFPQYSGVYVLEEATESEEGVKGDFEPPHYLTVTHRMEFTGNHFRHVLGFQATPAATGEALGHYAAELSRLLHTGTGAFPSQDFSGTPFRTSKSIDESHGAFCILRSYEYQAAIHPMQIVPDPGLLKRIYPRHQDKPEEWTGPEVHGSDPEEGKILIEAAEDSVIDEEAAAEWRAELAENKGITFTLSFSKLTNGTFSGCGSEGAYFVDAEYDTGSLTLRYRAAPASVDESADLREAPIEEATEGTGGALPDQITSFE